MLSPPSKTSEPSTLRAPESVHPLQEYVQSNTEKDFPDIAEDDADDSGEQEASSHISTKEGDTSSSDFTDLMPQKDFGELFEQFFVVHHNDLFVLRSDIFLKRDINPDTLLAPSDINAGKIQALRNQLYQLQMILFEQQKGSEYDITR